MRVLEHGVHIDVEKPMCVDLEQADAVVAKAKEKGVRMAVHHQGRVGAYMRATHKAFTEGRIGELCYINSRGKVYYGGYGLMNIGTHQLNDMMKFAGPLPQCFRHGIDRQPSHYARRCGSFTERHGNDCRRTHHGDVAFRQQRHGKPLATPSPENHVYHDGDCRDRRAIAGKDRSSIIGGAWELTQSFEPDGWEALEPLYPEHYDRSSPASIDDYWYVEEYVNALDENRDHECSGAEGQHNVEIMMGIFESAAYGNRVDLPQQNREHPLLRWRRENGLPPPAEMPRAYDKWQEAEDRRIGRS